MRNLTVNSSPRPVENQSLLIYPLTGANAFEIELTITFDYTDADVPLAYTLYYISNGREIVIVEDTHM